MNLRGRSLFVLAVLCGALELPREGKAELRTLRETLEYAREHASRVEMRAAERDRIRADARSQGFLLPEPPALSGEWVNRESPGNSETQDRVFEGALAIEPFGQGIFRARAAGAAKQMGLSRVDAGARTWAADVAWTYQERLRRDWIHDRTQEQSDLAQRLVYIARERFRTGDASQLELDLAQVEAAEVRGRVLESEASLREAEHSLAAAIGWPAASSLPEPDSLQLVPAFPDTTGLLARAMDQQPEVLVARATLSFAKEDARLANMQLLPRAEVAGSAGREEGDDVRGIRIGLSLPLFSPSLDDRAARGAERRRAEAEVRAASRDVLAAVESTRTATTLAFQQVSMFLQEVIPNMREARQRIQEAYAASQIDLATVLVIEQRFRDVERSFAEALGVYTSALRDLEIATGVSVLSGYDLEAEPGR